MKKLVFDVSDAQSILDSDSVGAWVRAGTDGDLIGSQNVNSQDWLNTASILYDEAGAAITGANPLPVDLVSPLAVNTQIDGDYDGATNTDPDSAGIIAHDRAAAPGEAQQNQRPTAATPTADNVAPANVHGLDVNSFMMGFDGTNYDRITAQNVAGSLDVYVTGSGPLTINDAALANTAIAAAVNTLDVAGTSELAVTSALANRKYLWIYNRSNKHIFIGQSGITQANGYPVPPEGEARMRAGAAVAVHYVGRTGQTPEIRTLELS